MVLSLHIGQLTLYAFLMRFINGCETCIAHSSHASILTSVPHQLHHKHVSTLVFHCACYLYSLINFIKSHFPFPFRTFCFIIVGLKEVLVFKNGLCATNISQVT